MNFITYIMPTIGRTTAPDTIDKVASLLHPGDELIVVGDGPLPEIGDYIASREDNWVRYYEHSYPTSTFGNAQRDFGMSKVDTNWFMFIDDDDEIPLDSLQPVRDVLRAAKRPVVFAMDYYGKILSNSTVLTEVGGPQLALPGSSKCRWMLANKHANFSDNAFISAAVAEYGGCDFSDIVVAKVTHHGRGVWF